ncbi:hypothetical protein QAD02_008221 [Eretmocerus hayati]|uniref:Uncharacterized protein n=1 Tax=Eretmocerus hayati TaxID=131215 RepID=A0ACC2N8A3_9HYME|nr:hypothetical protein QAD02_008221 [Eretmocerus hayati]
MDLLLSADLNFALCFRKTQQHLQAEEAREKRLELDPTDAKVSLLRDRFLLQLASPEFAVRVFQESIEIRVNDEAAADPITICHDVIKKDSGSLKESYANMFESFATERQQDNMFLNSICSEERKLSYRLYGILCVWGQEERPGGRDATAFENEIPNIPMLNANGTGDFKNM